MLKVGTKVPNFKTEDQNGNKVTNLSLEGQKYIVFFYPKDDSPGCTKQACSVRDQLSKIKKIGYQVFGVSPDKVTKHCKFINKYDLNYSLLADPSMEMINAFQAYGKKLFMGKEIQGVLRYTYFIDELGMITNAIKTGKTKEHGNEILQEIKHTAQQSLTL